MQHPLSKRWRPVIIQMMVVAMVSLVTSCGKSPYAALAKLYQPSPDTDVSSLPPYNFVSFAGTVWKTKVRTAVASQKRYTGEPEVALLVPRRFDPTQPDYMPSHDTDIIAVLPVGTQVQIERLMKDNGAWGGLMVTATVESGTNSWKNVVLDGLLLAGNGYIPRGPTWTTNWDVELDMLAPCAAASQSAALAPEIGDPSQAGYQKGYANGKANAILANDALPHNKAAAVKGLSDPWQGLDSRPMAVKIYGEDYAAAYESAYRKGFHDYFEEKN
jgi:hypothetical protein